MATKRITRATTVQGSSEQPRRLSKAGIFLQTWPKGEILDMRAVLK